MQFAVAADHLFDGKTVLRDHAAVVDGPVVHRVMPRTELPDGIPVRHLPDGAWLTPGFIDAQVNGGGGLLFNDDPSPRTIACNCRGAPAFRNDGTAPDDAQRHAGEDARCPPRDRCRGRNSTRV